jgi:hypothetical protein
VENASKYWLKNLKRKGEFFRYRPRFEEEVELDHEEVEFETVDCKIILNSVL